MMLLNNQNPGISAGVEKTLYGVRLTGNGFADLGWGGNINPENTPMVIYLDITVNDNTPGQMFFASNQATDGTDRLYIGSSSSFGCWDMGVGSTGWNNTEAEIPVSTGRHIIVLELDGTDARLWVDGQYSHTLSYSSYVIPKDFCLSGWSDNGSFQTRDSIYHSLSISSPVFSDVFLDYRLNEGSGAVLNHDGRVGGTGSLNGTYYWETISTSNQMTGKSLYIPGTGSSIRTNITSSQIDSTFTAEANFKIDNVTNIGSTACRIITADKAQNSSRWSLGVGNSRKLEVYTGATFAGGPKLDRYRWYHAALVVDGTSLKVYLDGELVIDVPDIALSENTSDQVAIGGRPAQSDRQFWGWIKEVRLWDVARPQAQIKKFKDRQLTGREKGLLAYFPWFQDNDYGTAYTTGTTPHEIINLNYSHSSPQLATGSPEVVSLPEGYAIRFDGANDSYSTPSIYNWSFTGVERTARAVFIPRNWGGNFECVVHMGPLNSVGSSALWIGVNATGNIVATIGASEGGHSDGDTGIPLENDKLYEVEVHWDGSLVRTFVNGEARTSYVLSSVPVSDDAVTTIGASKDATQYHFSGDLLELETGASSTGTNHLAAYLSRTLVKSKSNNGNVFGNLYGIKPKIEKEEPN